MKRPETLKPPSLFGSILLNYKVVLLRDPISLKLAMSIFACLLGVSLTLTTSTPSMMQMLDKFFSIALWGWLFTAMGVVGFILTANFQTQTTLKVAVSLFNLFVWVILNVSSLYSKEFSPLQSLLLLPCLFEVWILVHTWMPHSCLHRSTDVVRPSQY